MPFRWCSLPAAGRHDGPLRGTRRKRGGCKNKNGRDACAHRPDSL